MSEPLSYSESMLRLQEIIRIVENETPDVDTLTSLTEEAILLISQCRKRLKESDEKIEKLLSEIDENIIENSSENLK